MIKKEDGTIIFTADDAIEWLIEACETWKAGGNDEEDTEGLRWAIETIKYRQQKALEAEARKAKEDADHV